MSNLIRVKRDLNPIAFVSFGFASALVSMVLVPLLAVGAEKPRPRLVRNGVSRYQDIENSLPRPAPPRIYRTEI